jgi:hypothetical protein
MKDLDEILRECGISRDQCVTAPDADKLAERVVAAIETAVRLVGWKMEILPAQASLLLEGDKTAAFLRTVRFLVIRDGAAEIRVACEPLRPDALAEIGGGDEMADPDERE